MKFTDQEQLVTESQDDGNPAPAVPFVADRGQVNAGVVVFSSTRKALYVNEAAQELLMRLNRKENEDSSHAAIPRSVDKLLDEMLPLLRTTDMSGWKQLEAIRLVASPNQRVLVKAYGIRLNIDRSLIVLTVQETAQAS